MDPDQFPDSAQTYGLWDTPKAYFHLLKDNQIIMDWDRPLESFGGKTAFEVSIYQGFASHKTQVPDFSSGSNVLIRVIIKFSGNNINNERQNVNTKTGYFVFYPWIPGFISDERHTCCLYTCKS
jgi:hypothetical protein